MARSVSIGTLGLHNVHLGPDSLIFKCYDRTKAEQGGKKGHDKNVCANLLDPVLCSHFALAAWSALENARFEETEFFSQKKQW